ncbi:MAG TPA: SCO family protein, partial [Xanthobacteraceae bacterium]|nr:SCO family protein [Xanthobacteraceae bacterium]
VCPVVIEQLREVYSDLSAEKRSKLVLLSISVDPVRDTTERLADLWRGEGAFEHWIVARPAAASVDRVTRELGIWVYAKTDGTINHSTDLFLIDPKGRIVRVFAAEADSDRMGRDLGKYL